MPSKSKPKRTPAVKQQNIPISPKWPSLEPLVPKEDLRLETLLEGQILVIRNFFTSTLCKNYISFLSSLPLVTTPGQPKKGEAVRVNDRFQIDDQIFAEQLWHGTGLQDLVTGVKSGDSQHIRDLKSQWGGEVCGLNPRIRIYRYSKGQFFAQHFRLPILFTDLCSSDDESNVLSIPTSPPTPAKTTWTLLIYLTGPATGCVGGETVFYPEIGPAKKFSGKSSEGTEPVVVGLEVGMALLHKHGQDCLLHEGMEVTAGEKWVIRSDLCVKR
ncbi:MAG: hypothetical protein LQ342_002158 [Letrouitia transgressa]|nr:MAG: hypothetical protein LQ342_002158 [Letrouitia transgressa]